MAAFIQHTIQYCKEISEARKQKLAEEAAKEDNQQSGPAGEETKPTSQDGDGSEITGNVEKDLANGFQAGDRSDLSEVPGEKISVSNETREGANNHEAKDPLVQ